MIGAEGEVGEQEWGGEAAGREGPSGMLQGFL